MNFPSNFVELDDEKDVTQAKDKHDEKEALPLKKRGTRE